MRILRRRAAPPGADPGEGRALAAANKRIVELEMDKTTLQHRINKMAGRCATPCHHELLLEAAQFAELRLRTEHADVYQRIRATMTRLYELTDPAALDGNPETPR